MALVNCSVLNHALNKMILPWSILSVERSGVTIQQFYDEKITCKLSGKEQLDSAYLGKSKESLDSIELCLALDSAVALFGPLLRYVVHNNNYLLCMMSLH